MTTTLTFRQGVGGYTGVVDTTVQQASQTTAFGSASRLGVDTGGNAEVESLLVFKNIFGAGAGQIPLGSTITSATLTLQTTNGSTQGGSMHRLLTDWTGQSTWASLGNGIQFDGTEAVALADTVTGAVSAGSRAFDVTKTMQEWASGATNYGWAFKAGGSDGWDFYSSEGATKPLLTVTYTTADGPPPPLVSIAPGTPDPQTEGAGAKITFAVALERAASQDVVVSYSTLDGSATAANDFFGVTNGSITFAAGETSKTVEVLLKDDALVESREAFSLRLNSATNAGLGATTASGNIVDDDVGEQPPIVSVAAGAPDPQTEGADAKIRFTVSLDRAASQEVVVGYSTIDGTATAASDFFGVTAGSITFAAGEITKAVDVLLRDDAVSEEPESFSFRVNSATNASLGTATATATGNIRDDDNLGASTVTFRQGIGGYTGVVDTTVQQASQTTAFGGATKLGVDTGSNAEVESLLVFKDIFGAGPGQIPFGSTISSATLTLQTTNGSNQGGSLHRLLTDWTGQSTWASLGNGIQFDGTEAMAAADAVSGAITVGSRAFDVTRSLQAWASGATNYGWAFKAGGTDGWDFYSSEGATKPLLTVSYTAGDGPPPPLVSVQPGTPNPQTEGADAKITFAVALDRPASQDVVVTYSTIDGSATAAGDFFGVSNDSITFAAGETSKTVDVLLKDDALVESRESFSLRLNSATNAGLGVTTAAGNIVDNDGGNPPPPGTVRVPEDYATIQEAVDAAPSGATILVGPGTYSGGITIAGKSLTLVSLYSLTGDPAYIDQTIISGGEIGIYVDVTAPRTTVQGFHFVGNNYSVKVYGADGQVLDSHFDDAGADAVSFQSVGGVIRGNRILRADDDAVDIGTGRGDLLIENNVIETSSDDGIEIRNRDYVGSSLFTFTIRDNTIGGSGEDGIQIIDYPANSNRMFVIERNLITGSADVGLGLMDNGETIEDFRAASVPERIHVFNNTFDHNTHGITGGDNLVAVNNIITNSSTLGLKNVDGGSTVAHTLLFGNATDSVGSNVDATTVTRAAPLYDSSFGLQSGSPAIDAGVVTFDYGSERVLSIPASEYSGASVDLGWQEYLLL